MERLKEKKGLRAGGGGTKAELPELYPMMRTWFDNKRAAGMYVDGNALVYQFQHLMRIYQMKLNSKKETSELTLIEIKNLNIIDKKLISMKKKSVFYYWVDRLRIEVGGVWRKPQRLMNLTPSEEEDELIQT